MEDNKLGMEPTTQGAFAAFAKSTLGFSASVATFVTGVDALKNEQSNFKESAKKWAQTFNITALIKATQELTSTYMSVHQDLSKSLSLAGSERRGMTNIMREEAKNLIHYGITMQDSIESTVAMTKVFGNFDFASKNQELIGTTNLVAKGFHVTNEAAGELVAQMSILNNMGGDEIISAMGSLSSAAQDANISTSDMMENIRGAGNMMYLFNQKSETGRVAFSAMATSMTTLGLDMASSIKSIKQFRDVGTAVSKSAELSGLGIQVGPRDLMRASFVEEQMPAVLFDVFKQMEGMDNSIQEKIAESISGGFGTDMEGIMKSFAIQQEGNMDFAMFEEYARSNQLFGLEAGEVLKEQATSAQSWPDKIGSQIKSAVEPISSAIGGQLVGWSDGTKEWGDKNISLLQNIIVILGTMSAAMFVFTKGKALLSLFKKTPFGSKAASSIAKSKVGQKIAEGAASKSSLIRLLSGKAGDFLSRGGLAKSGGTLSKVGSTIISAISSIGKVVGPFVAIATKTSGVLGKVGGVFSKIIAAITRVGFRGALKTISKKLPLGIGAIIGLAIAVKKAFDGDFKGAAMEAASGLMTIIPGWGTAASFAMEAAIIKGDIDKMNREMAAAPAESTASKQIKPGVVNQSLDESYRLAHNLSEIANSGQKQQSIPLQNHIRIDMDGSKVGEALMKSEAGTV